MNLIWKIKLKIRKVFTLALAKLNGFSKSCVCARAYVCVFACLLNFVTVLDPVGVNCLGEKRRQ